jgi:hypothetical protein
MRFADEGHNRDVVFGVLLGRQCEPGRAAQIADSVAALHASRREAAANNASTEAAEAADAASHASAAGSPESATMGAGAEETAGRRARAAKETAKEPAKETAKEADTAGGLSSLWFQFLNGLRF